LFKAGREAWLGTAAAAFPDRSDAGRYLQHHHSIAVRFRHGACFERGMLEGVALPEGAFQEHSAALLAMGPMREAWLTSVSRDRVPALASSAWLGRITALSLNGDLSAGGMAELVASPHLSNLRLLSL